MAERIIYGLYTHLESAHLWRVTGIQGRRRLTPNWHVINAGREPERIRTSFFLKDWRLILIQLIIKRMLSLSPSVSLIHTKTRSSRL